MTVDGSKSTHSSHPFRYSFPQNFWIWLLTLHWLTFGSFDSPKVIGAPKVTYQMKQAIVELQAEAAEQEPTLVWRKNGRTVTLDTRFKQSIRTEGSRVIITLSVDPVSSFFIPSRPDLYP